MSRPLRLEFEGAVRQITSRGNQRKNIFRCEAGRFVFLAFMDQAVKLFDWLLRSWVLMTNHFHLVLETPRCTLSRGMHWLNTKYARYFNRRYKRVHPWGSDPQSRAQGNNNQEGSLTTPHYRSRAA